MDQSFAFATLSFLFGTVFGSFGNVLIYRLPQRKSVGGRSACPHCKKTLGLLEIIPIISFIVLRGRCRKCHHRISLQYPLVELASGALFVVAYLHECPALDLAVISGLCLWLLLLIAVTDARTGFIPDALSIPFVLLALLRAILFWGASTWAFPELPILVLQSAFIAGGFLGLQWLLSRGRLVGSGDVILATGIGFLLPDPWIISIALWIAYVTAAIVAAFLLMRKKKNMQSTLVFGPFLAGGATLSYLYGEEILQALLGP